MDIGELTQLSETMHTRKRPKTRSAYEGAWRRFRRWCAARDFETDDPFVVGLYLIGRYEAGLSLATLSMDRNAIRYHHDMGIQPSPTEHVIVKNVLAGLRGRAREDGRPQPRQARGITAERFRRIRETAHKPRKQGSGLESEERARRRAALEVALIAVMRDAMLRRGEAVALRWSDVAFRPDGTAWVVVRESKTSAEPAVQHIRKGAADAVRLIMPEDPDPRARVFGYTTPASVTKRIKRACAAAGLGEKGYSGHSPRVGMAQDLAANGAALPAVMVAGRWQSPEMPARYARKLRADRSAVAALPED
ncbi:MAG: tyrosine-type recombinase/integrase [Gemmatimonadetes bacterium]|nr:tyrosine-type recombinase/integrase [Gemmatimonadota bacterium]